MVGISVIRLHLPGIRSLKAKRTVVKSLTARLRREFNVSCAEVDLHDVWQSAEIGVAVVSNSAAHARDILNHVVEWIEFHRPDVQIVDHRVEMIHHTE